MLLPFFFLAVLPGVAQYGAGIAGGTYEGVWGLGSQPASILLNPVKVEINIHRTGVDLDNTYLHLDQQEIGLFGFGRRIRVDTSDAALGPTLSSRRSVSLDVRSMLPSFSLRIGTNNAIAFTNNIRATLTALDLNELARKFGIDAISLDPGTSRRMEELKVLSAAMSWTEHGITYGHTFQMNERVRLHSALTGKYVIGIYGMYIDNQAPLLSGINDSVQVVSEVNADYAIVYPPSDLWSTGLGGMMNGQGWGMDAGAVIEWMRDDTATATPYWLRIGAAITDVGSINYTKRSEVHEIRNGVASTDEIDEFEIEEPIQLGSALSELFLNDPNASLRGRSFRMVLPMAVHASVDYCPVRNFALRLETIFGLTEPTSGTTARNQLSIVPRYEIRNFSLAIPITMDEYAEASMGLSIRIAGFMIGSDRIGGLVGLNSVSGADLYFGMKVRIKGKS